MPTVQRLKFAYNNVYLLKSGAEQLLIDTGPDYEGAAAMFRAEFATTLPDLVVATHGHLDHAGLGGWWQSRGVPVALHERDAHFAAGTQMDDAEFAGLIEFVSRSGAPPEVAADAVSGLELRREWSRDAARASRYRPAGRDGRWPTGLRYLPFDPRCWLRGHSQDLAIGAEFLHMPGHTPGNGVVWVESEGWLFSGDQLLPEIAPTPALQAAHEPGKPWRFRSLPSFLGSLRTVRTLGATRCYPGHGEPFDNVAEVVDANLAQAEQRTARLREMLRESPGTTVYGLAEALYPRALRRRFWQIIATVQGHLDILEEAGEAVIHEGSWFAK